MATFVKTNGMTPATGLLLLQAAPDFFRSTGKIYVVVAVIALVLVGFFVFLYLLDRRLTKLEDQINQHE